MFVEGFGSRSCIFSSQGVWLCSTPFGITDRVTSGSELCVYEEFSIKSSKERKEGARIISWSSNRRRSSLSELKTFQLLTSHDDGIDGKGLIKTQGG